LFAKKTLKTAHNAEKRHGASTKTAMTQSILVMFLIPLSHTKRHPKILQSTTNLAAKEETD